MKKRKKEEKKPKTILVEAKEIESLSLVLRVIAEEKKLSTSLIQRKLKIGYAAAAHLIDRLSELKIIKIVDSQVKGLPKVIPLLKVKPVAPAPKPKVESVKSQKNIGRPSIFSMELAKTICDRIASGESVLQICRDDGMPIAKTVYLWLLDADKKEFLTMYEQARVIQADVYHDEMFDIADDGSNDWMDIEIGRGNNSVIKTVPDYEHIKRSCLRVDTRKWVIARMNPRKYGEKIDLTSGNKPIREPRTAVITYLTPPQPKTA